MCEQQPIIPATSEVDPKYQTFQNRLEKQKFQQNAQMRTFIPIYESEPKKEIDVYFKTFIVCVLLLKHYQSIKFLLHSNIFLCMCMCIA